MEPGTLTLFRKPVWGAVVMECFDLVVLGFVLRAVPHEEVV